MNYVDESQFSFEPTPANHFTKKRLLKIHEIYEFCKSAQSNSDIREVINAKFAKIAEQAEQHICDFANGKLTVDNDALDLMKTYIDEFGRNYYRHDGKMTYEYSLEASKAKIKLEKMAYQATCKTQSAPVYTDPMTINLSALAAGTADEFVNEEPVETFFKSTNNQVQPLTALSNNSSSIQNEPIVQKHQSISVSRSQPSEFIREKTVVTIPAGNLFQAHPNTVATDQPPAVNPHKKTSGFSFKKIKAQLQNMCSTAANSINHSIKRYGAAAVTLFSSTGAYNGYTFAYNETSKPTYEIKALTMPNPEPKKTLDLTSSFAPTSDSTSSYGEKFEYNTPSEANFFFCPTLEETASKTMARQAAEEDNAITLADLHYTDYKFTAEDLEAMLPSETARTLAEKAQEVAQRMNSEGYCFRGVKRAFKATGLGEMYGRSAYMAKKQLDNNPHFVRINCDIQNTDKLPDGGIAVYGRSTRHPHGHIGVYYDGKDCSSKIRNAIASVGSYNGVDFYLPADIKVPQQVIEKINAISVLKNPVQKKVKSTQTVPTSAFLLAVQNMKINS